MYEAKTKPTEASVSSYLAAIEEEERRRDCEALVSLMERVTGCAPKMWGTSIVGFDSYHYKYASGHEGDSCVVGFSSRKGDISVYLLAGYEDAETKRLLAELGKHKTGWKGLPVYQAIGKRSVSRARRAGEALCHRDPASLRQEGGGVSLSRFGTETPQPGRDRHDTRPPVFACRDSGAHFCPPGLLSRTPVGAARSLSWASPKRSEMLSWSHEIEGASRRPARQDLDGNGRIGSRSRGDCETAC
jgi:hypothetical protein